MDKVSGRKHFLRTEERREIRNKMLEKRTRNALNSST